MGCWVCSGCPGDTWKDAVGLDNVNQSGPSPRRAEKWLDASCWGNGLPKPAEDVVLDDGDLDKVLFEVSLFKDGKEKSFGFAHKAVEDDARTLLVVGLVADSPVARWNAKQTESGQAEHTVREGDRIVAVAGAQPELEPMRAQLQQERVNFTVERWPDVFTVPLRKKEASDRLGLRTRVTVRKERRELVVAAVSEGIVEEWNRRASASRRPWHVVLPGLAVVAVCDVADDAVAMQSALKERSAVEVTFSRPAPRELQQFRRRAARGNRLAVSLASELHWRAARAPGGRDGGSDGKPSSVGPAGLLGPAGLDGGSREWIPPAWTGDAFTSLDATMEAERQMRREAAAEAEVQVQAETKAGFGGQCQSN